MEKLRMESADLYSKNVAKLAELFPNCITETADEDGGVKFAVDFDKLRQNLADSGDLAQGPEAYDFTWVGKRAALAEAYKPIRKTLRPCPEESVDWDNTQNLYIEGDNLDVLKLLQESYLGKVKMIYIDPPYNTGADSFVYPDNFRADDDEYNAKALLFDEEGNKVFKENVDTNPRFHSDWCSMMYSRLLLARNLLADDGVIFISIDDREQDSLKKICSEIYGERNFLAQIVWERAYSPVNLKKHFSESHDFILCYAKCVEKAVCNGLPRSQEANSRYSNPDNDSRGLWMSDNLSVGPRVESRVYEIITPSGRSVLPPSGYCWRLDKKTFEQYREDNRIWFGENGGNVPRIKRFMSEVKQGMTPMTIWKHSEVGHSQEASQSLKKLFKGKAYFDYPKPVNLIKRCVELYSKKDCIVLDFFSGSATTAQAVMQYNSEHIDSQVHFVLVQIPEPCDSKKEAYKDGFKTICDIGKERIRQAAKKIKNESDNQDLDVGFRVLKVDESNMKPIFYGVEDMNQSLLEATLKNIKDGRDDLDLLFGCLLDWGLPLSLPYKEETIEGAKFLNYADGALMACFDDTLNESVMKAAAMRRPTRVVFRDSCFKDSATKINLAEIFKLYSPETTIKTL